MATAPLQKPKLKVPSFPTVSTSSTVAENCVMSGDGLTIASCDQPTTFQIEARDAKGERSICCDDTFFVFVRGPSRVSPTVTNHGDGMHTAAWLTHTSGQYYVAVTLFGAHVTGSPFPIYVYHPKAHAPNCTVSGEALTRARAREKQTFEIRFRDQLGHVAQAMEVDVFAELLQDTGRPKPKGDVASVKRRQSAPPPRAFQWAPLQCIPAEVSERGPRGSPPRGSSTERKTSPGHRPPSPSTSRSPSSLRSPSPSHRSQNLSPKDKLKAKRLLLPVRKGECIEGTPSERAVHKLQLSQRKVPTLKKVGALQSSGSSSEMVPISERSRLVVSERQNHSDMWMRRLTLEKILPVMSDQGGTTSRGVPLEETSTYKHELVTDPTGFAFGGTKRVQMEPNGRYATDVHHVSYSVGLAGRYLLHVRLRKEGLPVPGSPFALEVMPGEPMAHTSFVYDVCSLPDGRARATLRTCDVMGNACLIGGADVACSCPTSDELDITVNDTKDGLYQIDWTPQSEECEMNIKLAGEHVTGSPLPLELRDPSSPVPEGSVRTSFYEKEEASMPSKTASQQSTVESTSGRHPRRRLSLELSGLPQFNPRIAIASWYGEEEFVDDVDGDEKSVDVRQHRSTAAVSSASLAAQLGSLRSKAKADQPPSSRRSVASAAASSRAGTPAKTDRPPSSRMGPAPTAASSRVGTPAKADQPPSSRRGSTPAAASSRAGTAAKADAPSSSRRSAAPTASSSRADTGAKADQPPPSQRSTTPASSAKVAKDDQPPSSQRSTTPASSAKVAKADKPPPSQRSTTPAAPTASSAKAATAEQPLPSRRGSTPAASSRAGTPAKADQPPSSRKSATPPAASSRAGTTAKADQPPSSRRGSAPAASSSRAGTTAKVDQPPSSRRPAAPAAAAARGAKAAKGELTSSSRRTRAGSPSKVTDAASKGKLSSANASKAKGVAPTQDEAAARVQAAIRGRNVRDQQRKASIQAQPSKDKQKKQALTKAADFRLRRKAAIKLQSAARGQAVRNLLFGKPHQRVQYYSRQMDSTEQARLAEMAIAVPITRSLGLRASPPTSKATSPNRSPPRSRSTSPNKSSPTSKASSPSKSPLTNKATHGKPPSHDEAAARVQASMRGRTARKEHQCRVSAAKKGGRQTAVKDKYYTRSQQVRAIVRLQAASRGRAVRNLLFGGSRMAPKAAHEVDEMALARMAMAVPSTRTKGRELSDRAAATGSWSSNAMDAIPECKAS